jgi:hypothetical protein
MLPTIFTSIIAKYTFMKNSQFFSFGLDIFTKCTTLLFPRLQIVQLLEKQKNKKIPYMKLVVFPFKFCDAAIVVTFQNIFSLIGDTFVEDH